MVLPLGLKEIKIIAAFFADMDIDVAGNVFYRYVRFITQQQVAVVIFFWSFKTRTAFFKINMAVDHPNTLANHVANWGILIPSSGPSYMKNPVQDF
jgi:hypothetical protein